MKNINDQGLSILLTLNLDRLGPPGVDGEKCAFTKKYIRDWSLITGRGGLQNGRGGHVKFYSFENGLKGGHKKFRGSFYAVA